MAGSAAVLIPVNDGAAQIHKITAIALPGAAAQNRRLRGADRKPGAI
jgi:hypothetical protein